jgi:hypothetical protein
VGCVVVDGDDLGSGDAQGRGALSRSLLILSRTAVEGWIRAKPNTESGTDRTQPPLTAFVLRPPLAGAPVVSAPPKAPTVPLAELQPAREIAPMPISPAMAIKFIRAMMPRLAQPIVGQ